MKKLLLLLFSIDKKETNVFESFNGGITEVKKFQSGDIVDFVYPDKYGATMILQKNMAIDIDEPEFDGKQWYYPIIGKANPSPQQFLQHSKL